MDADLGADTGLPATAPQEPISPTTLYSAFTVAVWANQIVGSYTPPSAWSYASGGRSLTVTWTGTGRARVDVASAASATRGNAQVVAYGSTSNRCKVASWWVDSQTGALSIDVRCHTVTGAPVSTPFVAVFTDQVYAMGAHVWSSQPSASHTPSSRYSFNGAGGTNQVRRTATGRYTTVLPGIGMWGGNAQVTAYGTGPEYCKVLAWNLVGGDTQVDVACFDTLGRPADSRFSLQFLTYDGYYGLDTAYVWGNDPTSPSYTPSSQWQEYASCAPAPGMFNCVAGTDNRISRRGVGQYTVTYPGAGGQPSSALVTAWGVDNTWCKVESWSSNTPASVNVRCYSPSGALADARYSQRFFSQ